MRSSLPKATDAGVQRAQRILNLLRRYHQHKVYGMEHIPRAGRCLVVVNHSLATYDIGLLMASILKRTGRMTRGLGDRALFRFPDHGRFVRDFGVVLASPENGQWLLEQDELVFVAPGGMREALRPSTERYQLMWQRRKGFIKLAMQTGTPVILAACPDADRLYRVYESDLTKVVYKEQRLPLPLLRGWGPTFVPRPVKLTHVLSEPLIPTTTDISDDSAVDAFHEQVTERMEALMREARQRGRLR